VKLSEPAVLLLDRDAGSLRTAAKLLIRGGFVVTIADCCADAVKLLEAQRFDLLIVDLASMQDESVNIIEWASKVGAAAKIIGMRDIRDAPQDAVAIAKGAELVVAKPLDVKRISELIESPPDERTFGGRIEDVDILEVLQFMLLAGRKTVVEVNGRQAIRGRIFIDGGRIRHAVFGEYEGEEALFNCVCCPGGRFSNERWYEPERYTIDKPGDFLLLEAARRRDENRNGLRENAT
jgi:ActR/RegA family two-component response regulator